MFLHLLFGFMTISGDFKGFSVLLIFISYIVLLGSWSAEVLMWLFWQTPSGYVLKHCLRQGFGINSLFSYSGAALHVWLERFSLLLYTSQSHSKIYWFHLWVNSHVSPTLRRTEFWFIPFHILIVRSWTGYLTTLNLFDHPRFGDNSSCL